MGSPAEKDPPIPSLLLERNNEDVYETNDGAHKPCPKCVELEMCT